MIKAANPLGIVFFPAFDWAISSTHPEREERLLYTRDQLAEEGIFDVEGIDEYKPLVADTEDIERVHFCFPDAHSIVTRSHAIAAGGAIRCGQLVATGQKERAFSLCRPPGHHAMKSVHGTRGFCTVNMEAIMIEHLREHHGVGRVAIIDTDCHHGDGTQDIYWHDPDTLFISLHQDGRTLYPGTGFLHECGGPQARGRTINIPLPPHTSDDGVLQVIREVVLPILEDFAPDMVINSAGQDNHYSDPITNMNVSAQGYARLNELLRPDIAVLEGGYAIQGALPYVNLGIAMAMAGLPYDTVREPDYDRLLSHGRIGQSSQVDAYIDELCRQLAPTGAGGQGKVYENPPPMDENQGTRIGDYYVRVKEVFYDTDGIRETQNESVRVCDECRGNLRLVSRSGRVPESLGVEIPVGACEACVADGYAQYEEAQIKGGFRYIQFIDRVNHHYERYGF